MKKVATIKIFETQNGDVVIDKNFKADSIEDMGEFLTSAAAALVYEVSQGFDIPIKQVAKYVKILASEISNERSKV